MARKVEVDIKTRGADKASRDLGKVDKGLGRLAKSAGVAAAGFFGARALISGFQSMIDVTKQQVLVEAQLNAVLKSTASVAGVTAKELTRMATALQKQTRFGDEAIIKAQSLMLTFTKVGKDVFPDAIETVLNMSEAMGQDLQQGVIQVGKALNDPILGVTALRRVGVQLSAQQEQQVRDFVAVNDIASAQKIILSELETQFGGVAKAAGETLGGSLDQMSNAVGDAGESLGELLSPAIISIANGFTTAAEKVSGFFKSLRETELETTIRELAELGINVEKLEKIRTERIQFDLLKELSGKKSITEITKENVDLEKQMEDAANKRAEAAEEIDKLERAGLDTIEKVSGRGDRIIEQNTEAYQKQLDANQAAEDDYLLLLRKLEANYELLGQYDQLKIVQEQIASFQKEGVDSGEDGGDAEKVKATASEAFKKNSKDASTSLLASAIQGKEMANAGEDFTKSVALAVIQLIAQLAIEKRITDEKKQQARLATVGKIFGFGFQTGGSFINKFPTGGSFNVNKRTTLPTNPPAIVGDNGSAMERIDITPLPAPPRASDRNINIYISAPLVDETVVDHIIPAIRRAEKLNL